MTTWSTQIHSNSLAASLLTFFTMAAASRPKKKGCRELRNQKVLRPKRYGERI